MRGYAIGRAVPYRSALSDYLMLTKPGIVALVLVSALTGMYMGGGTDPGLIFWALTGIALATAASCVFNNYVDRDIDRLMERTSARPLALGTVPAGGALLEGVVLMGLSMSILITRVNAATTALTALASFIYVVVYGMALKRRTHLANQAGGISGALPPVMGYAAATGGVGLEVLALFAIVVLWQQPHALSLALKYRDQYRTAGVPAFPVVKGVLATKKRIAAYTAALLPVSMLPWWLGTAGTLYLLTAFAAGSAFLALGVRFLRSGRDSSMSIFFYSIIYLTVVFLAMVVDMRG